MAELEAHADAVDIARAQEIERETRHDVMAEIRTFAEQCPTAGGIIHLGATSADITDNADALRQREALDLLLERLRALLAALVARIEENADLPVMAHTHIQPAEPTTLGYRFAVYAQDLLDDYDDLRLAARAAARQGAQGGGRHPGQLRRPAGRQRADAGADGGRRRWGCWGCPISAVATQTYSRQQDLRLLQRLAGVAASLHKFALDFRVLQSPPFGEWAEPFGKGQVGSSAMPFKRNPINAENICSLARYVAALPGIAWDNASQAVLERSLDDSANRRLFMAEAFLLLDELLARSRRLVTGMTFVDAAMTRNMETYGPFAATERIMMAAAAAGADRQQVHEWLRESSLLAWTALRDGDAGNPLIQLLLADNRLTAYVPPDEIRRLMAVDTHVGTAPERARALADAVRARLAV